MQDNLPDSDNPVESRWIEYVTIGLGALFGVLLLLMALDSLRRLRMIDAEFADMVVPAGVDGGM